MHSSWIWHGEVANAGVNIKISGQKSQYIRKPLFSLSIIVLCPRGAESVQKPKKFRNEQIITAQTAVLRGTGRRRLIWFFHSTLPVFFATSLKRQYSGVDCRYLQHYGLSHAPIICSNGTMPIILITRFMLYASTCKLISVAMCLSVRIRKCWEPIQNLIVQGAARSILELRHSFQRSNACDMWYGGQWKFEAWFTHRLSQCRNSRIDPAARCCAALTPLRQLCVLNCAAHIRYTIIMQVPAIPSFRHV